MSVMIVVFNTFRIITITTIFVSIQYADALPDDYCLEPLNTNDCGGKPTPVFHYYKPGSRCEIKIWKGCPTRNKFYSEPDCSHFCIGLLGNSEENLVPDGDGKGGVDKTRCEAALDTRDCGADPTPVYTYNKLNHTCQKIFWKGCQSKNIFLNEIECIKQCTFADYWVDKINDLNEEELQSVLDLFETFEPGHIPDKNGEGNDCERSTDNNNQPDDNDNSTEADTDRNYINDSLTEEPTKDNDIDKGSMTADEPSNMEEKTTMLPVFTRPKTKKTTKLPVVTTPKTKKTTKLPVVTTPKTRKTIKLPVVTTRKTRKTTKLPVVTTPKTRQTTKLPEVTRPKTEKTTKLPVVTTTKLKRRTKSRRKKKPNYGSSSKLKDIN